MCFNTFLIKNAKILSRLKVFLISEYYLENSKLLKNIMMETLRVWKLA